MVDLFSVISGQQYPRVLSPSPSAKTKKSVSPNPNENVHKQEENNGEYNQEKMQKKKKKKPSATLLVQKLPTPKTIAEISSNLPLSLLSRPCYPPTPLVLVLLPYRLHQGRDDTTKTGRNWQSTAYKNNPRRKKVKPKKKIKAQSEIRNQIFLFMKNIRLLQARNRDPRKAGTTTKTRFKSYCNDHRVQQQRRQQTTGTERETHRRTDMERKNKE